MSPYSDVSDLILDAAQVESNTRLDEERCIEVLDRASLMCRGCQHIIQLDRDEWIAHYRTCPIIVLVD